MSANHKPLSAEQIRILAILASKAYDREEKAGRIVLPAEVMSCSRTERKKFWKHQRVAEQTQRVTSTKDMIQDEYLPMKAMFEQLAGESKKAYGTALRDERKAACTRDPGCEWLRQIHDWLHRAGYQPGYMIAIMKAKFRTSDVTELAEWQLKQLMITITNRCRAKLGLGDDGDRNKLQRAQREQQREQRAQKPSVHSSPAPAPETGEPKPGPRTRLYKLDAGKQRYGGPKTKTKPVNNDDDPF